MVYTQPSNNKEQRILHEREDTSVCVIDTYYEKRFPYHNNGKRNRETQRLGSYIVVIP